MFLTRVDSTYSQFVEQYAKEYNLSPAMVKIVAIKLQKEKKTLSTYQLEQVLKELNYA